jgi:hypothetical protein
MKSGEELPTIGACIENIATTCHFHMVTVIYNMYYLGIGRCRMALTTTSSSRKPLDDT